MKNCEVNYRPKLDREVDLKGATPESLAKALLRPRSGAKHVVCRESPVKQVATDNSGDSASHFSKRI